jgi:purine catabolism regulator
MLALPSVSQILALPELTSGQPDVVAGAASLNRPVRWVHISELPDIAYLLNGGELLLTTGIGLPGEPDDLSSYVESLAAAKVSALVIELGRRFTSIPSELVSVADEQELPLIALQREVHFVQVTLEAHSLIINRQLEELELRNTVHETFTQLALEGGSTSEVVRRAAGMLGRPVLFETINHQVIESETGSLPRDFVIDAWLKCCRQVEPATSTRLHSDEMTWLVTPVGARGEIWGRLAFLAGDRELPRSSRVVLEQAAVAIAFNRLVERHHDTLERQSHRSLLSDLMGGVQPKREIEARARALGVHLNQGVQVGCVARQAIVSTTGDREREALEKELTENVVSAARRVGIGAIIAPISHDTVGLLIADHDAAQLQAHLQRLSEALHGRYSPGLLIISAGSIVDSNGDVRRSFREAEQIADAINPGDQFKLYYQLPDVRLRGLLHLLRDDSRVQTFLERELGRLIDYDQQHRTNLMEVLRAYLAAGRNKASTASALGISRPALYERLSRIETILSVDLESTESCLSLHVALVGMFTKDRNGGQKPG